MGGWVIDAAPFCARHHQQATWVVRSFVVGSILSLLPDPGEHEGRGYIRERSPIERTRLGVRCGRVLYRVGCRTQDLSAFSVNKHVYARCSAIVIVVSRSMPPNSFRWGFIACFIWLSLLVFFLAFLFFLFLCF